MIEPVSVDKRTIPAKPEQTIFDHPLSGDEIKNVPFSHYIGNALSSFWQDLSIGGLLSEENVRVIQNFYRQTSDMHNDWLHKNSIESKKLKVLLEGMPRVEDVMKDLQKLRKRDNLTDPQKGILDKLMTGMAIFIKSDQLLEYGYRQWGQDQDYMLQR